MVFRLKEKSAIRDREECGSTFRNNRLYHGHPPADSAQMFPHTTMLGQGHEGSWVERGQPSHLHPGKKTSPSPALLSFGCFEINSLAGEGRGEGCTKSCAIKKPTLQECRGSKTSYHLSEILHRTLGNAGACIRSPNPIYYSSGR